MYIFYYRLKAKLIDGKQIAKDIISELRQETEQWMAQGHRAPQLTAILVGEDPASTTYVKNKMKAAKEVGNLNLCNLILQWDMKCVIIDTWHIYNIHVPLYFCTEFIWICIYRFSIFEYFCILYVFKTM